MNRLYSIFQWRRSAALEAALALETKRREWERKRQIEAAIEHRISEGKPLTTKNAENPKE